MSNFTLTDPNLTQFNESATDIKKEEAISLLKQIIEPILNNNIVDLGMVRNLQVIDNYVYLRLYLGEHQLYLQNLVETRLKALTWCHKIYVQTCRIP